MKKIIKLIISGFLLFTIVAVFLISSQCQTTGGVEYTPVMLDVPSTVAIVQSAKENVEDITYPEIKKMVKEAVKLAGGLATLIKNGDTVVLKPNLVTIKDYTLPNWQGRPLSPEINGTTTDWRITKAVAELVREINPDGILYVAEGSSVPTKEAFRYFKYTHEFIPGVTEFIAIETDSGNFKDESSPELVKIDKPDGLQAKSFYVNRKLAEADCIISLPCLKTHWHASVTGGIKNMAIGATPGNIYGMAEVNPVRISMVDHTSIDLHKWIHDYYSVLPADFVIMDGLQGIQYGPTPCFENSGTSDLKSAQMNMRLILAGADAVAVDTIESLVMSWDPATVEYLKLLNNSKVGNLDTANIQVKGVPVHKVRKSFACNIEGNPKPKKITDLDAPEFSILLAEVVNKRLLISLLADKDLHKVTIQTDNASEEATVTSGFNNISIPVSTDKLSKIKIFGYDVFLNCSIKTISLPFSADGMFSVIKARKTPVVDGKGDDPAWQDTVWQPVDQTWIGTTPTEDDFSGRFKLVWDASRLYILAEIRDDKLNDTHPEPTVEYYNDDCLEIFIDENASGGDHTYNFNAFAYHISLSNDAIDLDTNRRPVLLNDHLEIKRTQKDDTTIWEIGLIIYDDSFRPGKDNRKVTLSPGKRMGLAVAYCDSDNGNVREHFMGSMIINGDDKNIAWMNADVFARIILFE